MSHGFFRTLWFQMKALLSSNLGKKLRKVPEVFYVNPYAGMDTNWISSMDTNPSSKPANYAGANCATQDCKSLNKTFPMFEKTLIVYNELLFDTDLDIKIRRSGTGKVNYVIKNTFVILRTFFFLLVNLCIGFSIGLPRYR